VINLDDVSNNLPALFGNPSKDAIKLAALVYAKAVAFDHRLPAASEAKLLAWAECFDKSETGVWPTEALDSVRHHYSKDDAWPMHPGAVVAYCARQPVGSSPEHARYEIHKALERFHLGAINRIAELTGVDYLDRLKAADNPDLPEPERSKFLDEQVRKMVLADEAKLIDFALEVNHRKPEIEG
jgi:hypothetical protein